MDSGPDAQPNLGMAFLPTDWGQTLISFACLAYFAVHLIRPSATFSPIGRFTSRPLGRSIQ
jgi:hypothetical protein